MSGKKRLFIVYLVLFFVSLGVRLTVWQNNKAAMDSVQYFVTTMYVGDAANLADGDLRTFLQGPDAPSDATILAHPPGYPILIAPVFAILGQHMDVFRVLQILLCSLAPIVMFMIAAELFDESIALVAGAFIALSPQAAYYSGILLPDGLCVLPLLVGVYFLVRGVKERRLSFALGSGVAFAISCWLRSNAMLLPLFAAAAAFYLLGRRIRLRFAITILAASIVVIAPITIRNAIVFRSFIPLSLGLGHMLVIGLGDEDKANTLSLPSTDEGETELDARRDGRPDYYGSLYAPDGVLRERERRGLAIDTIKTYPAWYASIVARRALGMLRLERVPVIDDGVDERGATPPLLYQLNRPLKLLQKLFITALVLPFCLLGLVMSAKKASFRRGALLLAVTPVYYMCVQSLIYTEYRFFLAASHFVLAFAAIGVVELGRMIKRAAPRTAS